MSVEVNPDVFEKVMRPDWFEFSRQVSENLKVSDCDEQNTVTIQFETDALGVEVLKGMFEGVGDDDPVNSPNHYQLPGGIEVIDLIKHESYLRGNILKYIFRAPHKGNELQDLRKARKYLDWEIERLESSNE